jgi:hypothetical protein
MFDLQGQSPFGSRTTITSEWLGRHGASHRQRRSGNAVPIGKRFRTFTSARICHRATAVSGNADRGLSKIRIMMIEIFTASERKTSSFRRSRNSGRRWCPADVSSQVRSPLPCRRKTNERRGENERSQKQ